MQKQTQYQTNVRAHRLAQLASNASLLAGRVAAQHMLATESGGQGSLLKGVIDLQTQQPARTPSELTHGSYAQGHKSSGYRSQGIGWKC